MRIITFPEGITAAEAEALRAFIRRWFTDVVTEMDVPQRIVSVRVTFSGDEALERAPVEAGRVWSCHLRGVVINPEEADCLGCGRELWTEASTVEASDIFPFVVDTNGLCAICAKPDAVEAGRAWSRHLRVTVGCVLLMASTALVIGAWTVVRLGL